VLGNDFGHTIRTRLCLVALSVPIVWVSKLGVLFTYGDYLCISGRHHALPELRCDSAIVVSAVM
jgi:hypothetical protein